MIPPGDQIVRAESRRAEVLSDLLGSPKPPHGKRSSGPPAGEPWRESARSPSEPRKGAVESVKVRTAVRACSPPVLFRSVRPASLRSPRSA